MLSELLGAAKKAIKGKKSTPGTKTKKGTKSATVRVRKSKAIPSKIQQHYGTRRELLRTLIHHELGWCTDDNLLYIKIGRTLKPVAKKEGSISDLDIVGTSNEVIVTKDSSTGKDIYTISLAGTVENALVPPVVPQTGMDGKILTANEDGTFEWKKPVVSSTDEIDL